LQPIGQPFGTATQNQKSWTNGGCLCHGNPEQKAWISREGGRWHYAAVGPNGEEHWSITTYVKIEPQKLFLANDAFGDADGNINTAMPQSKWTMNFSDMGKNTLVQD
jgi:uncharacterized protein YndB with AHSA1/START domain